MGVRYKYSLPRLRYHGDKCSPLQSHSSVFRHQECIVISLEIAFSLSDSISDFNFLPDHNLHQILTDLEQIREMIFKYISDYNNTPSNVLAGLTPNEYYQYKMTNILPQETYLGVNAESLNDLDSVIRRMREKTGHRRAKKETNNARTKKYTIDPLSRVQEDMTRLKRKSGSLQKAAAKIMKQVDLIENALLIKVSAAYEYLQKLIEEDPEKYGTFRNPANWSSQPELCYVQEFHKGFN